MIEEGSSLQSEIFGNVKVFRKIGRFILRFVNCQGAKKKLKVVGRSSKCQQHKSKQVGLRRDILFGVSVYPTNIHALSYILLGSFSTRATGVTVALLLEDITCVRVKLRCNHDLAEPYRP